MGEIDLTAAVEAGKAAAREKFTERTGVTWEHEPVGPIFVYAEAAVRAAAPIIERAVREEIMAEIGTTNSASFIDEHGRQGEVRGDPSIVEQVARLVREHGTTTTTTIPQLWRPSA